MNDFSEAGNHVTAHDMAGFAMPFFEKGLK
jgi:hypothetical protein